MSTALELITQDIYAVRDTFSSVLVDPSISFEREAEFAIQILSANEYAMSVAQRNRQSVVDAVRNLAAIGISLNPAKKQAYLVPRDGRICLDISYMGMLDLAVETGSIRWGQAKLVHQADTFEVTGLDKQPTHTFIPFAKDRGPIVGVYCCVKTVDGDYLTEAMSIDEVNSIRDRSTAWRAWIEKKKKCPWVTDFGEMAKKTVVKRAHKYWPRSDRLAEAIHHMNTDGGEGIELAQPTKAAAPAPAPVPEALLASAREAAGKGVEAFREFWKTLQAPDRTALRPEIDDLKRRSASADAQEVPA